MKWAGPAPIVGDVASCPPAITHATCPCSRVVVSPKQQTTALWIRNAWCSTAHPNMLRRANSPFTKREEDVLPVFLDGVAHLSISVRAMTIYFAIWHIRLDALVLFAVLFSLPFQHIPALIIAVVVLQIINSLGLRRQELQEHQDLWCRFWFGIRHSVSSFKVHTQDEKVFTSCSSWSSDPGILLLHVSVLPYTVTVSFRYIVSMSLYKI
jgi:hypothetical protein